MEPADLQVTSRTAEARGSLNLESRGTTGQQDICPEYFAQFRHALTDTPRESSRRYLAPRHDGFAVKLNLIPATFLRCAYNHHTWSTMRIRQYPACMERVVVDQAASQY